MRLDATIVARRRHRSVFISVLIGSRGGTPDLVVRAFVDDRISAVASPRLLAELELVLRPPKFAAYVDERTVRDFVERIRRHAMIVDDPIEQPAVTRDRKDDYVIASHTASTSTRSSAATAT